eukprot:CAMPEP_0172437374 /NCGR_PEP_ID=MMETSP1064-20121228/72218_1 /TAXON_ID=202472 /ORGANISM="Aulacoseira subarctica , Strain CCAP 1002/5" /LENGTH=150 /DNA_ID=CAMNT_0013185833 /DNA_START=451 /DNA_END=900 /DNA_ORIENTATION=+
MSQTMASRIRSVRGSMLAITNDGGLEDEEVESQHIVSENQAADILSPLQGFLNAFVYSNDLKLQFQTISQTMASRLRSVRGSALRITINGGLEDQLVESEYVESGNQAAETSSSVHGDTGRSNVDGNAENIEGSGINCTEPAVTFDDNNE